ncbi:MAG TPA: TolC family protein [Thermodesulfobacteriota bacterium]|nr:TolC family protein [Thermodesulfobacteriota bacterium]
MKNVGRSLFAAGLNLLFFMSLSQTATGQDVLPPRGEPLNADQCVAIALKIHPALAAGQASVEALRARVEQSLSAYYPQVAFNAGYSASTFNFVAVGGAIRQPTYNWTFLDIASAGPTATVTLYDFGRTANNVRISRENVKASQEDLATTRQTVTLNVRTAYYNVLQQQFLIDVAQDTVNQTQLHLDQAQGFYQAGTQPKIYVTNAEVALANAQLALIQTKNNFSVARATLNNAMGLRQDLNFAIVKDIEVQPKVVPLQEIMNSAYERRPEIQKVKAQQRAQEAAINLARAGYYPVLSGNAQFLERMHHPSWDPWIWDATVGATMSIPLFSGFLTPNQVSEARAVLLNLQAQEESTKQNIRLEAEQAYLALTVAIQQIEVTQKTVQQAKENYELASGRYQVGVGSPLEITDAEVSLANARANYIQAVYNYKRAQAQIEKAMGINR